jgi:hypothetical protein
VKKRGKRTAKSPVNQKKEIHRNYWETGKMGTGISAEKSLRMKMRKPVDRERDRREAGIKIRQEKKEISPRPQQIPLS